MWRGEVQPSPVGNGFYAMVETTVSDMTEEDARRAMRGALDRLNAPATAPAATAAGPGDGPQTGKVKWYNPDKGFGFIVPDDGGRDVFIHASVVRGAGLQDLAPDQAVTFTAAPGPKGPAANTVAA